MLYYIFNLTVMSFQLRASSRQLAYINFKMSICQIGGSTLWTPCEPI